VAVDKGFNENVRGEEEGEEEGDGGQGTQLEGEGVCKGLPSPFSLSFFPLPVL